MTLELLPGWYWLTIGMVFCFLICISLMIIQRASLKWYSLLNNNNILKAKLEHLCLYGQYLLASICSLQCLFNHISNNFPSWYCVYGMSICVIFHEASKTFGYGFFLERAKSTITKTRISVLPPIITKYVLPIYISLYFILYSILCPLEFRGLSIEPHYIPTACLFDEYESWVFYLSVGVEIFNSIFFLLLFAYPLYKIVGRSHSNPNSEQLEVIKIVKYNIAFGSISCISSVTFLLYRAFARHNWLALGHYLWLAGNIDLVINVICTFLMVTANRKYINYFCCEKLKKKDSEHTQSTDKDNNQNNNNINPVSIECTSLLIQDQISNMTQITNFEFEGKETLQSKNEQIQPFEPTVSTHFAERTTTADIMKQNFTQLSLF